MDIVTALQMDNLDIRVTSGDKWLYWNDEYIVLCHPYNAKKNITLYRGSSFNEALDILVRENSNGE